MEIISLPIELDKEQIDGRFRLVNMIAQRAKELAINGTPRIITKSRKVTSIAFEEALEYKLEYITGEEARQANEEARKLDYKKFLEEKRRESEQEDLSELEKDLKFYMDEKEVAVTKRTSSIESLFANPDALDEADSDLDDDSDSDLVSDDEEDEDSDLVSDDEEEDSDLLSDDEEDEDSNDEDSNDEDSDDEDSYD